ncbi:MAG: SRPBCC domain-containing protein [Actinobacteria bacterium]|nr:SRPBCC domain-containing protein [Actinomycetota bacterium]
MNRLQDAFVLNLKCVLAAPRRRIFALTTEPAELSKWWGPHGFHMDVIELDLRVGAGFRFAMHPPEGDLFHLSGEYTEIEPPSRLAYTFRWDEPEPDDRETVVRLSFELASDGTEVSLSQGEFATAERLELHRGGWSDSFERLQQVIEPEA